MKWVSCSGKFFKATVADITKEIVSIIPKKFYAAIYDNKWWIGKILDNCEEGNAKVQFIHSPGPLPTYFWPNTNDSCRVPYEHILKEVPVPSS